MFSVASQEKRRTKPVFFCHSTRCGNRSSAALRLPMKLSSTKIDRASNAAFEQFVEFGGDLLGVFQARIAAIKSRDIAEFALIRATARILDAAEEVFSEFGKLRRQVAETGSCETVGGLQDHLPLRAGRIARKPRDQIVCRIAEFTDMKIVERG